MGHKIKYGAKFFLKIKIFPYLPTHFWGVMLPETNILFILAKSNRWEFSQKISDPLPILQVTFKAMIEFW